MAVHKNALDLLDAQKAKFAQSGKDAISAWQMIPEGAEEDARELLGGTLPPSVTKGAFARNRRAARYNPRARARGQQRRTGGIPRLPINRQTGRLLNALERKKISQPGAIAAQSVGFDRAKAGNSLYVLSPTGTTKMVARGYWAEIKRRARTRNLAYREVFKQRQRRAMSN